MKPRSMTSLASSGRQVRRRYGRALPKCKLRFHKDRILSSIKPVAGLASGVFALLIAGQLVLLPQTATTKLPSRLEDYLTTIVRPTQAERRNLIAGQPITKLLDGDPNTEVSVFGAVWVKAPIRRYVEAVR